MDLQFLGSLNGVYQGTWNDVVFSASNDLTLIKDTDYVKQKVTKVLISPIGDDVYFENYGTELKFIIFDDITDQVVQNALLTSIIGGISYLQELEQEPVPSEQIKSIDKSLDTSIHPHLVNHKSNSFTLY